MVQVQLTEKPDLLPYQYFLNDIEFIQAKSKAKIEQNLDEDHITKMTQVVEYTLTERESLLDWLTSLTPEQHENMLLEMMKIERPPEPIGDTDDEEEKDRDRDESVQHSGLDHVLKYLLMKNNQWSSISKNVNMLSSVSAKKKLCSRMISKSIVSFATDTSEEGIKADSLIINMLKGNEIIMQQLWHDMEADQKIALFLKIVNLDQMKNIVKVLLEFHGEYPDDLSRFWSSMKKQNRLKVWGCLDPSMQKIILFQEGVIYTAQRHRLWDNIGIDNRLKLWAQFTEDQKMAMLNKMTSH